MTETKTPYAVKITPPSRIGDPTPSSAINAASNTAQVTNYDTVAEALARMRSALPARLTTALAYIEAVQLRDAVLTIIEGYEMARAFERTAGGL